MNISKSTHELYEEGTQKLTEIKNHFVRLLPFWVAGSLTALVATAYANLFSYAEHWSFQILELTGYWFVAVTPVFFFLSWFLVDTFAPRSNGSGIPQLMASVELSHKKNDSIIGNLLGLKIIIIKIFSSLLGVVGGGAIGREGPTLQISGSIFYLFGKHWKLSDIQNRSAFILAGAASGLASAFNTPLGGIVYVVEELAKSHLSTFRTGVLHSVIFAGVISQLIMGPYLYLGFPKISDFSWVFVGSYSLVAIVASLVVVLFSYLLKLIVSKRSLFKTRRAKALIAILTGTMFSLLAVFYSKNTMGPGKDLLNHLLFSDQAATSSDVISRLVGSLLTYSNGGAGGIFAPTLSLGGSTASFLDNLMQLKLGPLSVLIGMTAGLSALTHSPLTSFILILEMTDRHKAIFPLMLAAIIGHGISKLILKKSFYEFVTENILNEYKVENHASEN